MTLRRTPERAARSGPCAPPRRARCATTWPSPLPGLETPLDGPAPAGGRHRDDRARPAHATGCCRSAGCRSTAAGSCSAGPGGWSCGTRVVAGRASGRARPCTGSPTTRSRRGSPLADAVGALLDALDRARAARPLRSDRDRVPRGGLRTAVGRCPGVRRRRHPRARAAGGRPAAGGASRRRGRCGCGRPGSGAACRSTGRTRRSPTPWPAPSSTSRSARSCEARAPETTLTLRQVVA